jgi:3-methyladenine DNA glycosylase AlkC
MPDKKYFDQFINKETGKERYGLVQKEAAEYYKNNSAEECLHAAMEHYNSEYYYIQMWAVYIMGLAAGKNKKTLNFLKNTVSKNPSWQVQEFLAMAFDNYCKTNGYENSLETIEEWLNCKNPNNRRAVTEGLRIWTGRPYFKEHPQEAIDILSKHKTDESEHVRKSVGNALRDISKKYPELIKEELKNWKLETKEINQVYKLAGQFVLNQARSPKGL